MALCVLLSSFSSFFATSRFRSLHSENNDMMLSTYIQERIAVELTHQSGFLGARLAKSWEKEIFQHNKFNVKSLNPMFERIPYLLTTSSIMGSGLAASNWSFTLSSTARNIYHQSWCASVFIKAKHRQCENINTSVSNYLLRVWHWAPFSALARHPQECNSLVSVL